MYEAILLTVLLDNLTSILFHILPDGDRRLLIAIYESI
jgi:hypothetical protein